MRFNRFDKSKMEKQWKKSTTWQKIYIRGALLFFQMSLVFCGIVIIIFTIQDLQSAKKIKIRKIQYRSRRFFRLLKNETRFDCYPVLASTAALTDTVSSRG